MTMKKKDHPPGWHPLEVIGFAQDPVIESNDFVFFDLIFLVSSVRFVCYQYMRMMVMLMVMVMMRS
jgi:hypothetical protein